MPRFNSLAIMTLVIYRSEDGLVKMEAMVDPSGEAIWATQKAMGLLENVFSKELLLTSGQATDLFDVIRDYTYALDTLDAYDYHL